MRICVLLLTLAGAGCIISAAIGRERLSGAFRRAVTAAAAAVPVILAWLGMEFSQSFTTMFVLAEVLLTSVGGLGVLYTDGNTGSGRAVRLAGRSCFLVGLLCSLPASYIYAAGDDLLTQCIVLAVIAGLAAAGIQTGNNPSASWFLMVWFCWAAALFTALCGLRSTALLPYGFGLLLQSFVFLGGMRNRPEELRAAALWTGAWLSALFSVAPALF